MEEINTAIKWHKFPDEKPANGTCKYIVIYNESPEEKMERFMRLVEADKERRLKEEYEAERRKDESGGKKR